MLAYAVHINPLAHSDDVVICFDAPPTKQQAIGVLASLAAADSHPSGVSIIARCIEAVEQHGLPDLNRHNGKFEWRLPKPMPHWRYGKISIEEFEIYPIRENPKSEIRNPKDVGAMVDVVARDEPDPEAAKAVAALRALDESESTAPMLDVDALFARLGVDARIQSIVNNVASNNPKSLKFAAGMLKQLLADLVKSL